VEVYEASEYVGGMSRSFDLWGQRVDIGPHRFFSKDKLINGFFSEILEDEFTVVNRLTRIHYNNRFFSYPLKVGNVLRNLKPFTIVSVLWSYFKQKIKPIKNPLTFEDWVTNKFGKKLFEMFFKSYSEKLWGIPCSEIDADWAAQRIKTLSLSSAIISALRNNRGNRHNTLVDQFKCPKNGTGALYEKCSKLIIEKGGKIHLNKPIKKVLLDDNQNANGLQLMDGTLVAADVIISSMPLTNLVKGFDNIPSKIEQAVSNLYYRNTILVYIEVDGTNLFDDNWIYIHSNKVRHGRITNFRNWCPSLNKDAKSTILCMEFWTFHTEELWQKTDDEISNIAKDELRTLQLFSEQIAIKNSKVLRVPKSYPVYQTGYKEELELLKTFLDGVNNLVTIGRYGAFKYNNQDHSILMRIQAAKNITNSNTINLWDINTE
jgi:protoporphyrinogen oxidase